MSEVDDDGVLGSFIGKWAQTAPELELALAFTPQPLRAAQAAFACLVHELEYAAFGIAEPQPALFKLQWWTEELAAAGRGEASHPLAQALAAAVPLARVAPESWQTVCAAAFSLREAAPASDGDGLLAEFATLYQPLVRIQAQLFSPLDVAALSRARSLARVVRECANLAAALTAGRLPLPLDLLARHRLARGDLARPGVASAELLREWLDALRVHADAVDPHGLDPISAATLSADRWRLRRAQAAAEPLQALCDRLARVPLRATLAAWRARRAGAALASP